MGYDPRVSRVNSRFCSYVSSYCRPAFVEVYKLAGSCYGLSFRCLVETVAYRKKLSGEEQASSNSWFYERRIICLSAHCRDCHVNDETWEVHVRSKILGILFGCSGSTASQSVSKCSVLSVLGISRQQTDDGLYWLSVCLHRRHLVFKL